MAKSHNYWEKIVDFLIKAYLLSECQFSTPSLYVFRGEYFHLGFAKYHRIVFNFTQFWKNFRVRILTKMLLMRRTIKNIFLENSSFESITMIKIYIIILLLHHQIEQKFLLRIPVYSMNSKKFVKPKIIK